MERPPHRPLVAQSPLAQLALAFSSGILTRNFLTVSIAILLVCSALFSSVALLAVVRRRLALAAAFLMVAMLFAGAVLACIESADIPHDQLKRLLDEGTVVVGDPVELTGVVDGPLDASLDGFYFLIRIEEIRFKDIQTKASGSVALLASFQAAKSSEKYQQLELRHGARLRVMTTLRRADSYRNPGVRLFTEYLDRKGYDATGFVKSPLLIERLNDDPVFLPLAWLYDWRQTLQKEIDKRFSPQTAGVLDAALLGNRYNLSPATAERFRDGGTFHVLVISGLHITFIGGAVFLITGALTKRRELRFLLSMIMLWGYTLAVGAEASVVRAALMFTLVAFAPIIFRRASSLNALGAAAFVLLIWRPQNLFDPSFQLTFLSVAAIIVLAWPLLHRMAAIGSWRPTRETPYPPRCSRSLRSLSECLFWSKREGEKEIERSVHHYRLFKTPLAAYLEQYHLQRIARYVVSAIIVSGSVQIVLLPSMVIYFHRLSIASMALNIFVSLIMAVLAIVALAALLVAQFSAAAAAPLISLANGLNWLMVHSVDPFAGFGVASMRLPHYTGPAATVYLLYFAPLTLLAIALWRWNPLTPITSTKNQFPINAIAGISQFALVALIVLHPLSAGKLDGKFRVDFLDVGQGDSALLTMPDGTTLLIDGGGRPSFSHAGSQADGPSEEQPGHETLSIGEAVVSEYLWRRGLDSIDYILATHADADHIDGLNNVARNFHVRGAIVARAPLADPEFQRFAETLKARQIPFCLIGMGDTLRFGSVTASVLWPPASKSLNAPSRNNDSVTLRIDFGKRGMLFTGDIESGAETAILNARPKLRVDLVKVAHHGSKTSSAESFVEATCPTFAVISVGQTSVFGHPNKEVLERWKFIGAQVLTTGRSGTITVRSDGRGLEVTTFVP